MQALCMRGLKIISYNIWFEDTLLSKRLESLINIFNRLNPDVVCLQEVRQDIFPVIKESLNNFPYCIPKNMDQTYGCVILSRYPIRKFNEYKYPESSMGRSLLVAVLDVDGGDVVVSNSHFESMFNNYNKKKVEQFQLAENILNIMHSKYNNVLLCTDSNVMKDEEKDFFSDNWNDSWIINGGDRDMEYTYDGNTNRYLISKGYKYISRLDRILYRGDGLNFKEYRLIKAEEGELEPSDHYGVFVIFEVN